jgi:hypothetical protein
VMCPHCFATNTDHVKFCVNCGGLVREDDQRLIEDFILEEGLEKWREKKDADVSG